MATILSTLASRETETLYLSWLTLNPVWPLILKGVRG